MFDNVQGLNDGDDVNMLGKRIGKVSATKIMGSRVAVEVGIDQNFSFNIPIDSEIEVKSDGLMGSRFVAIKPGTNIKNNISNGEVINGKREVGIGDITPDIQPITRDLAAFSRNLRAILDDKQSDDIKKTLSNVESISSQLDSIVRGVQELFEDDMKDIFISKNDRNNISEFFENLNVTSKNLKKITSNTDKINSTIDNFSELSDKASNTFSSSLDRIDSILDNIESGGGSFGKLITTNELSDNLNNLVKNINLFVEGLDENFADYAYKYYRASKKADKDIKNEKKKK